MLKIEFVTAKYADDVYKNLCADDGAKSIFGYDPKTADKARLFKDFATRVDPSAIRSGTPYRYLEWICQQYCTQKEPLKAEDFYELHKNLNDFDAWSGRLHQAGKPNQIDQYESFAALAHILRPYQQKRAAKIAEKAKRRMDNAKRDKLMAETTVIYNGPEGKVVMPHTPEASIHWGTQTKWCIAAEKSYNRFQHYNKRAPIIIYLPKAKATDTANWSNYQSFKFASVERDVYNELDHSHNAAYPDCLIKLAAAAHKALSPKAQEYLELHGNYKEITDKENQPQKVISRPPEANEDYDKILNDLAYGFSEDTIDNKPTISERPDLLNNRDFILYALTQRNWLEYLPDYQDDEEGVLAAMENFKLHFEHASPRIRASKTFVMENLKECQYMLGHCDPSLQADPEVVRESLKHGGSFKYAFPSYDWYRNSLSDKFRKIVSPLIFGYGDLHDDRALFIDAIKASSMNYEYGSARLRDDEEILRMARGSAYQYTSRRLKKRKDIAKWAYSYSDRMAEYMPKSLRRDKDFVRELFDIHPGIVYHMDKSLKNDRPFMEELIDKNGVAYNAAGTDENGVYMRSERQLALRAVKTSRQILWHEPYWIRDREIVYTAIEHDPRAMRHFDDYDKKRRLEQHNISYDKLKAKADALNAKPEIAYKILCDSAYEWDEYGTTLAKDKTLFVKLLRQYMDDDRIDTVLQKMRLTPEFWGDIDKLSDPEKVIEHILNKDQPISLPNKAIHLTL